MADGGSSKEGGGGRKPGTLGGVDPEVENELLSHYLYFVLTAVSLVLIAWRLLTISIKYVRQVSGLNNDTQRFFARTSRRVAWFKRNILYAPIFRQRHNREFQLSTAINVGTLPTRMQLVFLFGYFATNVIFSFYHIDLAAPMTVIAPILRNRTGTLATVNLIPLIMMAGRNNPLIKILGLSFDTFNLLHRWFGRIVIIESTFHVLFYYAATGAKIGYVAAITKTFNEADPYLIWGWIGAGAFVVIGIQAASVPRHAFYEIFKMLHIALAAIAMAGVYQHLAISELPQLVYVIPAITLWMADRLARFVRLSFHNVGSGGTKTLVEALDGDACRVTVSMARPWTFKPGQHAYLYMPTISLLQSHPFSVAWSEEADQLNGEKLPLDRQDVLATRKTTMSFVIRARTGFTRSLYKKAAACRDGKLVTTAMLEGPYGGLHSMHSYGTVMLFAGGVGITNAVPHVRDLVIGYSNGTVAARKIVLVWIIQSQEHLQWIRPWMTEILALDGRRDCLRIMLFVTRPRSPKEIHSPSTTVQMFPGRPNIETLIGNEMENQVGTMGVSVCGPGVLSDEVRRAVRSKQYGGNLDFVEEAFSW